MSFFKRFGRHNNDPDPIDAIPIGLRLKLMEWTKAFFTLTSGRQYLENHLELLQDESEQFFTILIDKSKDNLDLVEKLRTSQDLLHTIRTHGSTKAAVRDAFTDEFNAFLVLDLPPWLDALRKQLYRGMQASDLIPLLRNAIARSQSDPAVVPEVVASLQMMLAGIFEEKADEESSEIIELASSALEVFTHTRFPKRFAHMQLILGKTYLLQGLKEHDSTAMQQAIGPFKAALPFVTRVKDSEDWGRIQMGLGLAYSSKGALHCATLHLTKALEVITEKNYLTQHTMIQEELERIGMLRMEEEMRLKIVGQVFDSDMAEGIRRHLDAADEDCADEL